MQRGAGLICGPGTKNPHAVRHVPKFFLKRWSVSLVTIEYVLKWEANVISHWKSLEIPMLYSISKDLGKGSLWFWELLVEV